MTSVTRAAEAQEFKSAMRHLAAGVAIIASGHGDERRGMTATAVCSVCADPPTILVCVNKNAEAHDVIVRTTHFSVNILSAAQQGLAKHFAAMDGTKGVSRFKVGTWQQKTAPLLNEASAVLLCDVAQAIEVGSHTVFLGRVCLATHDSRLTPLVYHAGQFRMVTPQV